MISLTLDQVASALGAGRCGGARETDVQRVCTDSREVRAGDLFVAIRGDRFDGHAFIRDAFHRGAVACVCDRRDENIIRNTAAQEETYAILFVDDTVEALGRLASHYRQSVMPQTTKVVAITGSNGKTTTKQMLHHVLSSRMAGRCAPRSYNNNIGVPLTILSAEEDDRYLIVEIGTNAPAEVAHLAAMSRPDIGVVTSVGEAHLSGLGTLAAVAAEKATLLDHLSPNGSAVVNIDAPELAKELGRRTLPECTTVGLCDEAQHTVSEVAGSLSETTCAVSGFGRVRLPIPGLHHAVNAALTLAVAVKLGMDKTEAIARLASFAPAAGRTSASRIGDITVIDDSYNANPTSVVSAVKTLAQAKCRRRVFVLGDMLELGDDSARLHRRVVREMADARIDLLLTVGRKAGQAAGEIKNEGVSMTVIACEAAAAAGEILTGMMAPGDAVWIKGSRANRLERIVEQIRANASEPAVTI